MTLGVADIVAADAGGRLMTPAICHEIIADGSDGKFAEMQL